MKRNGMIMMLLLIASSFSMKLAAQADFDALIKKCETMPSVDINIARSRSSISKELEREAISITIRDNPALVKEFLDLFAKIDETNAIQVTKNRKGGRAISLIYRFENATYSYIYNEEDKEVYIKITKGDTRNITVRTIPNDSLPSRSFSGKVPAVRVP